MDALLEQKVANQLAPLITELAELEEWPCLNLDSVLLIYDVLCGLKLSHETALGLLGQAARQHLCQKGVIGLVRTKAV